MKNANCAGLEVSNQGALDFVASLNATGTMNNVPCGDTSNGSTNQTDWRLPNIKELESLVNYRWVNPAFSDASGTTQGTANDPFSNFQIGSGYWSSTTYAGDSTVAWGINFSGPIYLVNNGNKTFVAFVLAVRGGKDF